MVRRANEMSTRKGGDQRVNMATAPDAHTVSKNGIHADTNIE